MSRSQDAKAPNQNREEVAERKPPQADPIGESREDRRLGFLLFAIGTGLLALPWLVPGAFQGVTVGFVIGKLIGAGFVAGGIYRAWTAHKHLVELRGGGQLAA